MAGFNKIEVVYKCDLKQNQLQDVFKNWEEKPKPYQLKGWTKEWESGYFVMSKVSADHFQLQRKIKSRGFDALVEVRYYHELKELKINISTPFSVLIYLLLPPVSTVILKDEVFAFDENGFGYLLGLMAVFILFLVMVLSISPGEKEEIEKDIVQQLHYAKIRYERQT